MSTLVERRPCPSNVLSHFLWSVQALLGLLFVGTGVWKLLTPVAELAAMIPWAGQVPGVFLVAVALIDLAGGLGIVLPSLTRIKPGLAVLAALGCAALQVSAIIFHLLRGEAASTPFNVLLVALSLFVFWGRRYRFPIPPRA
ncbi:DoxX family protein [Myxococcus sp. 1LA]